MISGKSWAFARAETSRARGETLQPHGPRSAEQEDREAHHHASARMVADGAIRRSSSRPQSLISRGSPAPVRSP